ncbi:glycosyltransferase family 31 protein [Cucurbitaria berberidis CBS 394.84]|uniref:Glycosyltransferase family 31 protein n=1 Tax=Cucurbitaria berberidis CBS 394.84 TaxID=1168544 RepID=A0A9P4GSQ5_9PLEO|nr:glycosyltransferase family 31 protein [Cucurbitaria berberidis CBS 394.84]KAF1850361.1 glycosyltransferase family 31 protein [Cucurbitaria berberidis CBS 394.84]
MPLFTPSRIAILVLSLSLISFFWTFGLPSQLGQPSLPIIDHYDHTHVHTEPIIPAPIIESTHATAPSPTVHGDRPAEDNDHRWEDATTKAGSADKPTTAPGSLGTRPTGHDEDGGRWSDKDKLTEGVKTAASAAPVPTTLLTALIPALSGLNATNATIASSATTPTPEVEKFCKDVHGAPNVMVVLRTSKAEMDKKLSPHLLGLLSCVPNFAIFSDHAGEFQGHTVHNALESISFDAKFNHDEFREYQLMHADPEHKPDPKKTKDLERWKFLPMVYKAYHLNPSAKFYVFIEADTSLSWTNLLQWVNRLDYRIPYYSGAPTFMNSVQFAQRGSGILLSQGALRRYSKSYDELYSTRWEARVGTECCGDLLLAIALNDAHVEFYSSWPLLQGEQPNTLDYTKKHWCVPAVSWHHINGEDLAGMWDKEKNWTHTHGWKKPYLYRDAFHEFVEPHMEAQKAEWDNLSQDTKIVAPQGRQKQMKEEEERSKKHQLEGEETKGKDKGQEKNQRLKREDKNGPINWDKLAEKFKDAGDTSERCQKACEEVDDCLQWRYSTKGDGECHLGKVLRLGKKTEGNDKWTSGWLVDRVKEVAKEWECKEVNWKFYQ